MDRLQQKLYLLRSAHDSLCKGLVSDDARYRLDNIQRMIIDLCMEAHEWEESAKPTTKPNDDISL